MRFIFFLSFVFTLTVAGPVVDQWGLGTNGVHNSPVFRFKPELRWTFLGNYTDAGFDGVVPLNNEEKTLYIASGSGNNPAFWKMNWDGSILEYYNGEGTFAFYGTISVRNGVIYIYNNLAREMYAADETSHAVLWTTEVESTDDYTTSPVTWSQDETFFAFATFSQVVALNASNGAILWQYPIEYESPNCLPLVYSKIDDSLVWPTWTQELVKVSMKTGAEIWINSDLQTTSNSNRPISVAIDDAGNIYGGTTWSGEVYKVDKDGVMVWHTAVEYKLAYSSTVLTPEGWIFMITNDQGIVLSIHAENGTSYLAYANDQESGTLNKWITGQIFWSQNVLYGVFQGVIAAYDTTDPRNLTQLWTIETGAGESNQGGISIAADGTLFLASSMFMNDYPLLTSVGCPAGLHLKPDGTQCVKCYAGYVLETLSDQCEKCSQGTFSNDGDLQCTPCTEDPTNEQCIVPPIAAPSSEPASNEPVANQPDGVPVAAPVKSSTPVGKTNSAGLICGSLVFSSLFLILM